MKTKLIITSVVALGFLATTVFATPGSGCPAGSYSQGKSCVDVVIHNTNPAGGGVLEIRGAFYGNPPVVIVKPQSYTHLSWLVSLKNLHIQNESGAGFKQKRNSFISLKERVFSGTNQRSCVDTRYPNDCMKSVSPNTFTIKPEIRPKDNNAQELYLESGVKGTAPMPYS